MKVVDPNDTSHEIIFIPRRYVLTGTTLELTNEATKVVSTVTHTITGSDALLTLSFDFTFVEGERFVIKLYDSTDDLYRGRILATEQATQEYDSTLGYYTYE